MNVTGRQAAKTYNSFSRMKGITTNKDKKAIKSETAPDAMNTNSEILIPPCISIFLFKGFNAL
jgi:hypothetical protein